MDQEVKGKWLAALRSGEFYQGTGALERVDAEAGRTYNCCLGVLCRVVGVPFTVGDDGEVAFTFRNDSREERWDAVPEDFAGLRHSEISTLISMNDEAEATFNEIADFIDDNL